MSDNSSLHEQVQEETTLALKDRQQAIQRQLATADHERHALRGNLHQIQQDIKARERTLLFTGKLPDKDEQLADLQELEHEAQRKLRELPFRIEQLREVAYAIRRELLERQTRLDRLARKEVKEAWEGRSAERIEIARRAVVDAMLGYAVEHGGVDNPLMSVEASAFFNTMLNPCQVNEMLRQKYEADCDAARKKVTKNNPKL